MAATFTIQISDPAAASEAANGGEPLRLLCRQEVEEFDKHMRENEPNWAGGLASWEKQILASYLYQKVRGRIEPPSRAPNDAHEERSNGEA